MKKAEVVYRWLMLLTKRLTDKQLMLILAIVVGLLAGLGTYIFEELLHGIKHALVSWFRADEASLLYFIYPGVGIVLASLFVRYVIKDNISEGVTRVLYAMSRTGSRIKPHNCYSSIVGGATTIGFGGSVGPEAPIVLTGSAIGSNIGKFMRLNYKQITTLLGCGAAAALAAIFKAPITGLVFVMEILMLDITMASIIPLLISSVSATTLIFILKGFDPILHIAGVETFDLRNIPMYIALGLSCGLISYYFTTVNSAIAERFHGLDRQYKKWILGGAILGLLIFIFPPLYGEGYESFTELMHGRIDTLFNNSLFYKYKDVPWVIIIYLTAILFFKVVAMAATNAAGGVGGTFAPSLFVGAFTGGVIAYISNTMFGMELPIINFTLVGMAGVMAGVMKAPLTSIFLIAELSNGYGLFIPLMIVTAVSFLLSYYFEPYSIYTKKLEQRGELLTHNKDKSVLVFLNLGELMETDFYELGENATLGDVVKLISTVRRNIFPVVSREGVLLGLVQLDDLRADMFDQQKYGTPVDRYMIPPMDTILPHEQTQSVLDKFETTKAWMLPVVDRDNRYLGFISKSRILAAYRQQLVEISEA
ncbi:MAG: chloride channel protein [Rikenellaceae bacterium]|nr:chloride channel protein [Rikenellaceae bacterium]